MKRESSSLYYIGVHFGFSNFENQYIHSMHLARVVLKIDILQIGFVVIKYFQTSKNIMQ